MQPVSSQQGLTAQYFEGVWKITKVTTPEGVTDTSPQPGLTIFSGGYFSITRVTSARELSPQPKNPTQASSVELAKRPVLNDGRDGIEVSP
jgi:hypothetical protein